MAAQVRPFKRERRFFAPASDGDRPPTHDSDVDPDATPDVVQNPAVAAPVRVEYPRLHTESTGARPEPDPARPKRARAAGARDRSS